MRQRRWRRARRATPAPAPCPAHRPCAWPRCGRTTEAARRACSCRRAGCNRPSRPALLRRVQHEVRLALALGRVGDGLAVQLHQLPVRVLQRGAGVGRAAGSGGDGDEAFHHEHRPRLPATLGHLRRSHARVDGDQHRRGGCRPRREVGALQRDVVAFLRHGHALAAGAVGEGRGVRQDRCNARSNGAPRRRRPATRARRTRPPRPATTLPTTSAMPCGP